MRKNLRTRTIRKKEHAEEILAEKMRGLEWFRKNDESKYWINKQIRSNLENTELEIEALQNFIDRIDNYLRSYGAEVARRKKELGFSV